MVPREPRAQVAALVRVARLGDAAQPHLLREDVRRLEHQRPRLSAASGVDDRDRRAVAVPDEDRVVDLRGGEDLWQQLRLVMHVPDGTGHRRPIRLAVARAAVYECRQPGSLGDPLRKIAPQARRPEALVQEHQCQAAGPANVLRFDLLAADAEEHGAETIP